MDESKRKTKPQAQRILVVRYRFLGDTILTVPFLRNLRRAYPDAVIDVLTGPVSGEVLDGCPYVNERIVFDTTRFHKYDSGRSKKRSYWSYVFELRKRRYDLVFVLKRSLSSAALSLLIGARHRIGYATEGRSLLLTRAVSWRQDIHEVASLLEVLQAGGIDIEDDHLEAWISDHETASVKSKVSELTRSGRKLLIHAAAAHPDKTYPLELWAQVIKSLCQEFDFKPFFTGAKEDRATYDELQRLSGVPCINLAGDLSIRESMAVYKEMDLAVCVDSGPAHLSAAVGTPTVTLFGPTDPVRWAPPGKACRAVFDDTLACRPCHYKKTCENRECLTELPPAKIVAACRELLSQANVELTC